MKKKIRQNTSQSGVALLLSVIITALVLVSGITIAGIVATQLRLASDVIDSVAAVYAADSGIEWQLYQTRLGVQVPPPSFDNNATASTTVTGSTPNFTIKSLGALRDVRRQFEVSF